MLKQPKRIVHLSMIAAFVFTALPAVAYNLPDANRWNTHTAAYGFFTASQGDPITLTWSILPDGVTTAGEGSGPSSLISMFDDNFGSGPGGADLTQRPWFDVFNDSYNRFSELTGITMVYEPGDPFIAGDENTPMSSSNDGLLGVRGDIRLGASYIDGSFKTLAYSLMTAGFGEIVLDSGDAGFRYKNIDDGHDARHIIMHETAHSLGMGHVESSDGRFLLASGIQPAIYGPQFDDLLGLHRAYGDFYEKSNNGQGNDTRANATSLGNFSLGPVPGDSQTLSIGTDAQGLQIAKEQTDFVSIDGSSDLDFFSFTLDYAADIEITLTPKGPEYTWTPEGGSSTTWNASTLNNLNLELLNEDGSLLNASASAGNGGIESVLYTFDQAGTYYVRVNGVANAVQMYQLDVTATSIPEPNALAIFAAGGLLLASRRRKTC